MHLESKRVTSVEHTRYDVPGWGTGELWTCGGVVLAHDFSFRDVLDAVSDTRDGASDAPSVLGDALADDRQFGFGGSGARFACESVVHESMQTDLDNNRCLTPVVAGRALVARFADFLGGEPDTFDDVELDLGWATPFQRAVARTLRAVPRGEVVSYGELAALAGYPGAARAVGTFCATNRFAFVVPCHRVVGAHSLGGYGAAGVEVKRRLLALEGMHL
jgi:methylated-DNA-[protein]-cysteine S-methyltransferase